MTLDAVAACVAHLKAGGLAVLPTETGYMLAADATSAAAIDAVYAAKGRPPAKPIHVAVASLDGFRHGDHHTPVLEGTARVAAFQL